MRVYRNTTLSFGLVTIPVHIFTTKSQPDIKFSVCTEEGERLNRVYMDSNGVAVPEDETARLYQSTVFSKETIDGLKREARFEDGHDLAELAIDAFIPLASVPRHRVENFFYVGPDQNSANVVRAYKSIVQAMEHEGVAAVCKWMPQTRQKLLVLYPHDGMLMGVTLCFADEVIPPDGDVLPSEDVATNDAEVAVAGQLIGALYDHEATMLESATDTAVDKLRTLLRDGAQPLAEPADQRAVVPDLMAALQQSLDQVAKEKTQA